MNARSIANRIVEELKSEGVQGLTDGDRAALEDIITVTSHSRAVRDLLMTELSEISSFAE